MRLRLQIAVTMRKATIHGPLLFAGSNSGPRHPIRLAYRVARATDRSDDLIRGLHSGYDLWIGGRASKRLDRHPIPSLRLRHSSARDFPLPLGERK